MVALNKFLGAASVVVSVVPVAYGVSRVKRWPSDLRALWGFLFLSAVANVAMAALALRNLHNARLSMLVVAALSVPGVEALGRLTRSPRQLQLYRLLSVAYLVFWVFAMLFLEKSDDYSIFVVPGFYLLMTFTAAGLIVARARTGAPSLLRDPAMVAALATLIMSAPLVDLGPVTNADFAMHPDFWRLIYRLRSICLIIGALLYFQALRWTTPRPS